MPGSKCGSLRSSVCCFFVDCNFITLLPYSILPLVPTCKGSAPLTPGHSLRHISKPALTLMQTYTGSGPGTPSLSWGALAVLQEPRRPGLGWNVAEVRRRADGGRGEKRRRRADGTEVRRREAGGAGRAPESARRGGAARSVAAMLSTAETSSCYGLNASLEYFVNINFLYSLR